jgi:hypothetical protein
MNLKIYPLLNHESRLAIRRTKWRYGWIYVYRPYRNLISRLSSELGMSEDQVRDQIQAERKWLIENPWYS